jgi:hypothetical protein
MRCALRAVPLAANMRLCVVLSATCAYGANLAEPTSSGTTGDQTHPLTGSMPLPGRWCLLIYYLLRVLPAE